MEGSGVDDVLGYNTGAVTLNIQSGGQFVELGANHTSLTTLNMTGGTIGSTGPGNGSGNIAVNGVLNFTSDAAGNPALVSATVITLNGGSFNVTRGAANPPLDMIVTSSIENLGASTLVKNGNGVMQLAGSSNYTGGTTINGGTCRWRIPRPWGP